MSVPSLEWLLPEPIPNPPQFTGFGAPVATLAADCFGPYELHLDPVRTFAFSQ